MFLFNLKSIIKLGTSEYYFNYKLFNPNLISEEKNCNKFLNRNMIKVFL